MFIREVFLLGYEYQKLINQYFDLSFFNLQALLVEFILYFYRFKGSAPKINNKYHCLRLKTKR